MSEEEHMDPKKETVATEATGSRTRRTLIKTAATIAVTAPAVTILLSASTKPAAAAPTIYRSICA